MFHSNQKLPTAAPPNYNSTFQDVQQQQLNYQSAFANNFGTNAGTGLVTHQPGKVLNFDKSRYQENDPTEFSNKYRFKKMPYNSVRMICPSCREEAQTTVVKDFSQRNIYCCLCAAACMFPLVWCCFISSEDYLDIEHYCSVCLKKVEFEIDVEYRAKVV